MDRRADVLVGQRALYLITLGEGDPHDVEVVRVPVARIPRDRLDSLEVCDALLVERDLPATDLAVPVDLVELDERNRREYVAEVRLVPRYRDVVERAVAAAHHAQIVQRLREIVAVR